jgi:hypothetical protein
MSKGAGERRDSRALEPELITDPIKRAESEAANGLRQFDAGKAAIQEAIDRQAFRLRPSLILSLHREALAGISFYAGNYRPGDVEISHSKHVPPPAHLVPELVEDMCEYVNDNWARRASLRIRNVEVELDSSFRGRKWPNRTDGVIRRPRSPLGLRPSGNAQHSRSNRQ